MEFFSILAPPIELAIEPNIAKLINNDAKVKNISAKITPTKEPQTTRKNFFNISFNLFVFKLIDPMIYTSERKYQSRFDAQKAHRLTMQSTKIAINCQLKRQITINFYFLNKKTTENPFLN